MFGRRVFGGTITGDHGGGLVHGIVGLAALGLLAGCSGDGSVDDGAEGTDTTMAAIEAIAPDASETLLRIGDAEPGDIVSLRADGTTLEWIDRREGEIVAVDIAAPDLAPQVIAEITVSTRGRDWGLIDSVVLEDGRRFASWTQPGSGDFDNGNLVVGEVVDGRAVSVIFNAGRANTARIGGQLDVLDDRILLALGGEVGWADDNATRGAFVTLDPDLDAEQAPEVVSSGYADPRAFVVVDDEIWVWDRAGERDPDEPAVSDVERYGRADLDDRGDLTRNSEPDRRPTALIELPDGRFGLCGENAGALYALDPIDERTTFEPGEAVMTCSTGATVLDDGTIVTVADLDGAQTLQIRRP